MATTYTTNYNLGKQENHADKFDMDVITDNADKIDAALTAKADKSTTYTKTEVDTALSGKQATLTTAQLDAVNSGITSADVTQIGVNENNISSCKAFTDNANIDSDRKLYISATEPTGNIPIGSTWINGKTVKVYDNGNAWTGTIEQGSWAAVDLSKTETTTRCRIDSAMTVYVGNTYDFALTGADTGIQFVVQYRNRNGVTVSESGWQTSPYSTAIPQGVTQITLIFKNENSSNCTPQDVGTLAINTNIWQ